LALPLRNRVADADLVRDESTLRQWQVRYQQLENQVRLEVEGAAIAVNQAREAYTAATETRALQEQSVAIELERYGVGLSTTALVLQYQSLLAQARSTEVAALDAYTQARTQLERALGQTLEAHGISIEEAYRGRVTTSPIGHVH
jgi:outer membrane protein TolC